MRARPISLFVLAICCLVGSYYAATKSAEFEAEKERIRIQQASDADFGVYHGDSPEFNEWDLTQIGLLVVGASLGFSAIWLRKK